MASPRQQEVDGPERTSVCVERKRFSRCVKMSKVQMLRSVVNQRLTAAAEEIFGLFERTIAEYEEELSSSKEENERQRKLLDAVFNPEVRTQGTDTQVQEEVPPEQHDWSPPHMKEDEEDEEDPETPHMKEDEEDPEPPHIKEEQEELWISQEGEQLQELEEAGVKFSFSPVTSEDDDDEDSGEPEPDIQQLLVVNEDVPPEQQDWSSSMDQEDQEDPEPPHIKEEQEELWISQEGEQPQGLKEAGIKFPFAPVKSEEDEDDEDEGQSSQHHQNQTENREAGSLKTEADGEEVRSISEKRTESKTGAKPFQCSVCGKTFARQRFLSQHMTVHTGEKPFSCSVCDKTFARKGNLKYHMTVHTGEKPFSCSVCGKKFPLEQTMKRHLIVHSEEKPFSCSVCGKTFPLEQTLKRHLTVHSEEKPFSCSFCGKTFALRGRLNCHMTVHTGGESIQFYENME